MTRAALLLPLLWLTAACAGTGVKAPSLAPRAAEAIDPRLPVQDTSAAIPADAALRQRLQALVARADGATAPFAVAIARAEQLAAAAGAAESESWIAAQQALSAAIAERYPVTRALGDLDALTAARVRERGGITPADQQQIAQAAEGIAAIDRAQAARIDAVQQRLAR